MLLGKRPRPQVRRTPSFAEFSSAVVFDVEAAQTSNQDAIAGHFHPRETRWGAAEAAKIGAAGGEGCWATRHVGSMLFPHSGVHCGNSGDGMAPFLRACGICNRRLGPGRDTYMYRGDIAFCSLECRQQQMNSDEQKEKCYLTSMNDNPLETSCSNQSDCETTINAT
ncbi:hypothetical protein B296_00010764 [Ensete ventricosum]|uniref:FLZ-type domain-containing protein n=1 Tax=Ensete ventricosum TaxID=4639 RepID=A0A427B8B8_ENSVE|nr:hypothetical protein B296_00010764 [Ensete ventricosum]